MNTYVITIARTNRDSAIEQFSVQGSDSEYLIDLLVRIERDSDTDLVFRHSCHHGSCGTCTVLLDGTPVLACTTRLGSLQRNELTIDPLPGFDVRADIAVTPKQFFQEIPANAPYLMPVEAVQKRSTHSRAATAPDEVGTFSRFENCIECGACVAACPVTESFRGPAALAAIERELSKESGRRAQLLQLAGDERGVDRCVQAFECSRVCPAGVYPSRKIVDLRSIFE